MIPVEAGCISVTAVPNIISATDAEFDLITSYFRAPDEDEGPQIEIHRL